MIRVKYGPSSSKCRPDRTAGVGIVVALNTSKQVVISCDLEVHKGYDVEITLTREDVMRMLNYMDEKIAPPDS